jgi:hypothetical protein
MSQIITDIVNIITEIANKFTLCVLPTQQGKTFVAIHDTLAKLTEDARLGRSIHMIFTMNTLLNNNQFALRLREAETIYGQGSVVIFASSYDGDFTHVSSLLELQGLCIQESTTPRIVVMCSHKQRFDDGLKFLQVLNEGSTHIKRAFAICDELHQYINNPNLRLKIETMNNLQITKGIMALTGTPRPIFHPSKFWKNIHVHYLSNYNDENYVGCNEMIFNETDEPSRIHSHLITPEEFDEYTKLGDKGREGIGFIKYILNMHPEILAPGSRSFIPAYNACVTHTAVRKVVFAQAHDAVVVIINGLEKTLQYKVDDYIKTHLLSMDNTVEVCERISILFQEHNLYERPLVVTGFNCVGMGQTLAHKNLGSFTSAIFGHLDLSLEAAYQVYGRITGRMKHWATYTQTQVYCPTQFMRRCQIMEECARNIAREYNGQIITEEEYLAPMATMGEAGEEAFNKIRSKPKAALKAEDTDKAHMVFDTQEEAIKYARDHFNIKLNSRNKKLAPQEIRRRHNNKNPTVDGLLQQMWGVNDKKLPLRMFITNDDKWCIYWRPSILSSTVEEEK